MMGELRGRLEIGARGGGTIEILDACKFYS